DRRGPPVRDQADRRRRCGRHRWSEAVPPGHVAGGRDPLRTLRGPTWTAAPPPVLARPLEPRRRGPPLRAGRAHPTGVRGTRQRRRTVRGDRRCHTYRGVSAPTPGPGRVAAVPGCERSAHNVRCARSALVAAVPVVRAGAPAPVAF